MYTKWSALGAINFKSTPKRYSETGVLTIELHTFAVFFVKLEAEMYSFFCSKFKWPSPQSNYRNSTLTRSSESRGRCARSRFQIPHSRAGGCAHHPGERKTNRANQYPDRPPQAPLVINKNPWYSHSARGQARPPRSFYWYFPVLCSFFGLRQNAHSFLFRRSYLHCPKSVRIKRRGVVRSKRPTPAGTPPSTARPLLAQPSRSLRIRRARWRSCLLFALPSTSRDAPIVSPLTPCRVSY